MVGGQRLGLGHRLEIRPCHRLARRRADSADVDEGLWQVQQHRPVPDVAEGLEQVGRNIFEYWYPTNSAVVAERPASRLKDAAHDRARQQRVRDARDDGVDAGPASLLARASIRSATLRAPGGAGRESLGAVARRSWRWCRLRAGVRLAPSRSRIAWVKTPFRSELDDVPSAREVDPLDDLAGEETRARRDRAHLARVPDPLLQEAKSGLHARSVADSRERTAGDPAQTCPRSGRRQYSSLGRRSLVRSRACGDGGAGPRRRSRKAPLKRSLPVLCRDGRWAPPELRQHDTGERAEDGDTAPSSMASTGPPSRARSPGRAGRRRCR